MKTLFLLCHMCGSHDPEVLTPAFLADGRHCEFQEIVICRKCGLVYKNPVIPELNKVVYSRGSWGEGSLFKKRIADLVSYLLPSLKDVLPKTIMEIGPGPGWLSSSLHEIFPKTKFVLLEASREVASFAKQNLPAATVVPAGIDEVFVEDGVADLVLACGVDYLFPNFRQAIDKIHRILSEEGHLYMERNVFVESEAYAGFPIKTYQGLFGQNALMTTWFALDQYRQFLSILFDVVSERSFLHDEIDGHKCVIHGFLCRKKTHKGRYYTGDKSWYEKNMNSLSRLSGDEKKPPPVGEEWPSRLGRIFQRVRGISR